jgi:hypothetical protein
VVHLNVWLSGIVFEILDTDQLPVIFHILNHVSIREDLAAVECVCIYLCTHTHAHMKFVNQNVDAFWDVFNCSDDDDGDNRMYGIWTNLKVKVILSSVVMRHLHCILFFWLSVGNNSKVFKFQNTNSKIFNIFACYLSDVQSVKFSFLFFCSKHVMNPVFSFY